MQQATSLSQATTTMVASSKAPLATSHTCVSDEFDLKDQQAPLAELPKSTLVTTKTGVLHFSAVNTAEDAFKEWPKIESQVEDLGGWKKVSQLSRNNFNAFVC